MKQEELMRLVLDEVTVLQGSLSLCKYKGTHIDERDLDYIHDKVIYLNDLLGVYLSE